VSKSKSKSRSRNGRQDGHRGAWSAASPTSGTNRITKDEPLAKDENRVMQGIARSFGAVASLDLVIWPGLGTLTMLETEFDELRLFPSVSGHDATLLGWRA